MGRKSWKKTRVHVPRSEKKKRPAHRKWDPIRRVVVFSSVPIVLRGQQKNSTPPETSALPVLHAIPMTMNVPPPTITAKLEPQVVQPEEPKETKKRAVLDVDLLVQSIPSWHFKPVELGYCLHDAMYYVDGEVGSWSTSTTRPYKDRSTAEKWLKIKARKEFNLDPGQQLICAITYGDEIVCSFVLPEE